MTLQKAINTMHLIEDECIKKEYTARKNTMRSIFLRDALVAMVGQWEEELKP